MADKAEPLVNVRELDTFLEDQMAIGSALAHALRFSKDEPFKSGEEADEAAQAVKDLKTAKSAAEKRKLGITAQWRATTEAVNAQYKELLSPVEGAYKAIERKALDFLKAENARAEEKRRQEQAEIDRKAEEAAEAAQKAAEEAAAADAASRAEAQKKANEARQEAAAAATASPAPPPETRKRLRGAAGSLTPQVTWHFEVTDIGELPDDLTELVAKEPTIKALVDAESKASKAEKRDFALTIPGVRIYSEERGISR